MDSMEDTLYKIDKLHFSRSSLKNETGEALDEKERLEHVQERHIKQRMLHEDRKLASSLTESKWMMVIIVMIVIGWLALVAYILKHQVDYAPEHILSKSVLITLLGTTTINIIGLLYALCRYVFAFRLQQ